MSLPRYNAAHVLGFAELRMSQTDTSAATENLGQRALAKVPEVTLVFWIIKIAATTLGETGGDAVSMSLGLGYLLSTAIFAAVFLVAVTAQIRAQNFHPLLYWLTIIATTTVGTTLADFADRSLGIGYAGGSSLLLVLLLLSLAVWRWSMGSVSINTVSSPKAEMFYWITIMASQTLGTALGDWMADSAGLGYRGAALVFGSLLAVIGVLYLTTKISRTILFWAAFVLTRPLGAVVGDFFDKPRAQGGASVESISCFGSPGSSDYCVYFNIPATSSQSSRALSASAKLAFNQPAERPGSVPRLLRRTWCCTAPQNDQLLEVLEIILRLNVLGRINSFFLRLPPATSASSLACSLRFKRLIGRGETTSFGG